MITYIMIIFGVFFSAGAQLLVKRAATYSVFSLPWAILIGSGMISYGVSFVLYSFILKTLPVSHVAPVMAISVMVLVVVCGILWGEPFIWQQACGVIFAIIAVVLLLAYGGN